MNQPKQTADADRAFIIGDTRLQRMTDPTVAIAISVNVDIRNGERSLGHNVPLHELPLMRRLYEGLGGTVRPRPDWVPAIKRRSKLSHLQLQDELSRLSRLYVVPTEGGKRDIMAEVYGATGAERLRALRTKMEEARELWTRLEDKAMQAVRATGRTYDPREVEAVIGDHITEKDILSIVRALDPMDVAAESIELDTIEGDAVLEPSASGAAPANPAESTESATGGSIASLFGTDEEGNPLDGVPDTTDLTDVDLLIANLREAGLADALAEQAALVITSHTGEERSVRLKERGIKDKALRAALKCGKDYDAATGTPV